MRLNMDLHRGPQGGEVVRKAFDSRLGSFLQDSVARDHVWPLGSKGTSYGWRVLASSI
jgi:hypothetical protein